MTAMSLSPEQQLEQLFLKSEHILLLLPANAGGDALGAAIGLARFLEKFEKKSTVAGETLPRLLERFPFLSPPKNFTDSISGVREFILSFNTTRNNIVSVRTERDTEEFRIFITPEKGSIDPRDFSFIPAKFSFDLVVVLGSPDKESLGKLFESNPDIFYEVPTVNIDARAENDRFGQVNFVEVTASSSSEIVANLLKKINVKLLDESVAEPLLFGIISATDSFQRKNTTPGALQTASFLMDMGGNQQKIITHLYRTQPFPLLKLWGRAMAGLKWDERLKLMWALVTPEDIVQSRARLDDLPTVLEKIRSYASSGALFMILYPVSIANTRVLIKIQNADAIQKISAAFPESKIRGDLAEMDFPHPAQETEMLLIETLSKTFLP